MSVLDEVLARIMPQFEKSLQNYASRFDLFPAPLREAMRYALFGGGKRIRPQLAMLGAEAAGGNATAAIPWAMAIEMVHTYSLIHDDLPAMDNDDMRRGRPTCHRAFGEANAILAGDALLTEAFAVIAQDPALTALLAQAAGGQGMVGGQVSDVKGKIKNLSELERMQAAKTGALIQAAVMGGAIASHAPSMRIEVLQKFGRALGLLFQLTDDLLDADQDRARDSNSFLHHMSAEKVLERRDTVADEARSFLAHLGSAAAPLLELTGRIQKRNQ